MKNRTSSNFILLLTIVSILCLSAYVLTIPSCKVTTEIIDEKTDQYVILKIRPPKHFYLDLKRVSDGRIFSTVFISKHCNNMCITVGDTIDATIITYQTKYRNKIIGIYEKFDNYKIHDLVCNCK